MRRRTTVLTLSIDVTADETTVSGRVDDELARFSSNYEYEVWEVKAIATGPLDETDDSYFLHLLLEVREGGEVRSE